MKKIATDTSISELKLKFIASIISVDEANEIVTKLKSASRSELQSIGASFRQFKGSLNICRFVTEQNEGSAPIGKLYAVTDENYTAPRQLLSVIAKLVNCNKDLDYNDVAQVCKSLSTLEQSKFDRTVEDIEYTITLEDYYKCAGVSDFLMRINKFPEHKDKFSITVEYSAYDCLKPKRVNGQLVTQNLVEELKTSHSPDLQFRKGVEIPFLDKIDSKYVALKEFFTGDSNGKESLTLELIEIMNSLKQGRQYDIAELPIGSIKIPDMKGDLYAG